MPYVNGTATDPIDLLQQLVTFLAANGWTTDLSTSEGSGWRGHLHNGSQFVHLRAAVNEGPWLSNGSTGWSLNLYTGTAFNGSNAWNNQTAGAPIASGGSNPVGVALPLNATGPYTNHYFFCDAGGNNVVVVVEKTPGLYAHLGWGNSLLKAGSWTGGPYIFGSSSGEQQGATFGSAGSNSPGYFSTAICPGANGDVFGLTCFMVRADVDSFTGQWVSISDNNFNNGGWTGKIGASSIKGIRAPRLEVPNYGSLVGGQFQDQQTSAQDGRANLLPAISFAQRDGTTTGFSMLGTLPFIFQTNGVGNGFSNASEYLLGSATYKMFPNFCVLKQ